MLNSLIFWPYDPQDVSDDAGSELRCQSCHSTSTYWGEPISHTVIILGAWEVIYTKICNHAGQEVVRQRLQFKINEWKEAKYKMYQNDSLLLATKI